MAKLAAAPAKAAGATKAGKTHAPKPAVVNESSDDESSSSASSESESESEESEEETKAPVVDVKVSLCFIDLGTCCADHIWPACAALNCSSYPCPLPIGGER